MLLRHHKRREEGGLRRWVAADETDAVVKLLGQMGREVARIDLADFPMRAGLAAQWAEEPKAQFLLDTASGPVDLARAPIPIPSTCPSR